MLATLIITLLMVALGIMLTGWLVEALTARLAGFGDSAPPGQSGSFRRDRARVARPTTLYHDRPDFARDGSPRQGRI